MTPPGPARPRRPAGDRSGREPLQEAQGLSHLLEKQLLQPGACKNEVQGDTGGAMLKRKNAGTGDEALDIADPKLEARALHLPDERPRLYRIDLHRDVDIGRHAGRTPGDDGLRAEQVPPGTAFPENFGDRRQQLKLGLARRHGVDTRKPDGECSDPPPAAGRRDSRDASPLPAAGGTPQSPEPPPA